MHEPDIPKTAFITDQGVYCYTIMPFGLKNAGATYQRLVNKLFREQIGRNVEVYVDDMLPYGGKCGIGQTERQEGTPGVLCKQDPPRCGDPVLEHREIRPRSFQRRPETPPLLPGLSHILLTDQPLRRILQKLETSGRMVSLVVELGEFDIQVRPRPAIKSQALADFIVESTAPATEQAIREKTRGPTEQTACEDMGPDSTEQSGEIHWTLHVDGSAGKMGRGAGVVLHGPDGFTVEYALRLDFTASNNEAEYKALLAGLSLAAELGAGKLKVYSDSQLIVKQVNGAYEARGLRMKRYLQKLKEKLQRMGDVEILQVPRDMNNRADALSKMASEETHDFGTVLTEILFHPSIDEVQVLEIPPGPNWMDPIMQYLQDRILPEDKLEARCLTTKAAHYVLHGPKLYKQSYTWPYLRCLVPSESEYALQEIEGDLNEIEFWKQPNGLGYRPCLEFSKDYKRFSDLVARERTKYLMVVVCGGLSQQRNQIVDAVVIARILGAALVVPILQVNVIWEDERRVKR
ncbi:uncharacterized protein LOC143850287 [Tasmannia lanceolata]|uniref:uncharacterized protein LOC143850287 n=1 Tax=Tasmannia lanceolata TaxID=3420 RepID=UPI004062A26C